MALQGKAGVQWQHPSFACKISPTQSLASSGKSEKDPWRAAANQCCQFMAKLSNGLTQWNTVSCLQLYLSGGGGGVNCSIRETSH